MGDIEGLIDKVNELKLDDNEELMKKIKQGIFKCFVIHLFLQKLWKLGTLMTAFHALPHTLCLTL